MDMNCMNSKSGVLIFVLVGIVIFASVFTSNNDKAFAVAFNGPVGLDVDSKGNVFVTEHVQKRLIVQPVLP
jgi:hypothetical protein